jgi:hypothetical protein
MSDLKLTVTHWGEIALDKRELRKLMRAAGNDVKNKTGRLINQSNGGGRNYPKHGPTQYRPAAPAYRASAPGQPPVAPTRALRGSLKTYVYKSGEGFAVRARQFYALFLEVGAYGGKPGSRLLRKDRRSLSASARASRARGRGESRVMEPRPFLDRVMAQEAGELNRRIGAALQNGLTWKETKAP